MTPFITVNLVTLGLVVLLGSVPYFIWMVYTACKHRWGLLGLQAAFPLLFIGFLHSGFVRLELLSVSFQQRPLSPQEVKDLFGVETELGKPLFAYHSEPAFNGDGYAFAVYALPDGIRKKFADADRRWMGEFPKLSPKPPGWSTAHWRAGPMDECLAQYRDFALGPGGEEDLKGLVEKQKAGALRALTRDGVYYAFFYNGHDGYATDVDLFIVDMAQGRLYIISLRT